MAIGTHDLNATRAQNTAGAAWTRFASGLWWIATGLTISLGTVIAIVIVSPLIALPERIIGINDFGEILAFFAPIIAGLGGIVGGLVAMVGDWLSTNVPRDSGLQPRARWIAALMSAGVGLAIVNPLLALAGMSSLASLIGLTGILALLARNVLFILLLNQTARLFGDASIGAQLPRFFLYWLGGGLIVAVACGIAVGGGVAAGGGTGDLMAGFGLFLASAVLFVAYATVLLIWLRRLIARTRVLLLAK